MVSLGAKDVATVKYLRRSDVFADAFNYFAYGGEQVIDPASLVELDTREVALPYGGDGAKQPVQRTRDVVKSVAAMTDRRAAYLILAIEGQSSVHYAMPVRNMVYDALQYARQVEEAAASHRRSKDYRGASAGEYLSGFMKRDRLMPVVTLAVYFGPGEWDGPRSLHEMFVEQDPKILPFVPDYGINLIAPATMEDADFDKFHTTLGEVLSFIKYSNDKKRLEKTVRENEGFRHLERDAVDVLDACTNVKLAANREDEEVVDVCQAIQEMMDEAAEKATAEATERMLDAIRNLMESMGWSAEQTMDNMRIPEAQKRELSSLL